MLMLLSALCAQQANLMASEIKSPVCRVHSDTTRQKMVPQSARFVHLASTQETTSLLTSVKLRVQKNARLESTKRVIWSGAPLVLLVIPRPTIQSNQTNLKMVKTHAPPVLSAGTQQC